MRFQEDPRVLTLGKQMECLKKECSDSRKEQLSRAKRALRLVRKLIVLREAFDAEQAASTENSNAAG